VLNDIAPCVELAPAKINLALHVVGRREDGYHLLESLVAFTRFGDRIGIAEADEDSFIVSGPFAEGVPTGGTNLVLRARDALRAALPHASARVSIRLEKNLPVASGIGGGSSDAAATLRGLAKLWDLDAGRERLSDIAGDLGADLPMCLAASPLIAEGIGDELTFIHGMPVYPMVLVNPAIHVATPAVFNALARADNPPMPAMPDCLDLADMVSWLGSTRNDLQAPAVALAPAIADCITALEATGAAFARMSGSGATCFGLFESGNLAKRAASRIREKHPGWFVAATRTLSPEDATHGQA